MLRSRAQAEPARTAESHDAPRRPARADLKPLRRLGPYLAPYKLQLAGAGLALTVSALTILGLGQGVRVFVDRGLGAGDAGLLNAVMAGLVVVIAVAAVSSYGRFFLVSWLGERVVADLRRDVFAHAIRLDPGFYETTKTAEIVSRLTADVTVLQIVVGSTLSQFLRNLLLLVGGAVMLVITSVKLSALVALVVPMVLVPIIVYGRHIRKLSRQSQDRVADVGGAVDETLYAIRTVQAFTREAEERARFGVRVEDAFATAVRRVRARALLTAVVIVLVFSAIGLILWTGGMDVLAGRMTGGELSAFVFFAILVAASAAAMSEIIGDLQRAAGATERLFDLLATPTAIAAPAVPVRLPAPPWGRIAFEAVNFHYPARPDESALDGVSFTVAPGETVALVGPSGAGKTTVFQLLLRYYDPRAGCVRLDGVDLRAADPADIRARLGLVPQDPVIFSADAWDNIRYGRPDATDAEVRAAARAAHALDFLDALPDGFDTFLGERGVRLSGGQRQRLAIARAILRDPAVLLLDEATSALDAESERAVQGALDDVMTGRTTLIIAHRLATVQKADRIIVLDRGRVVATGTHRALIAQGGLYARLAALQFQTGTAA